MTRYRYFILANCPDHPPEVLAIYSNKKEAIKHFESGYGYLNIKKFRWSNGKFPNLSEMENV